jgi:transcriptional regulator with XRE-family HTH domain
MPDRDISTIFVENLKQLLEEKNLTFAEFAKEINVRPSTISMWMTSKSLPRMELVDKIADFFDIDVVDLYIDRSKYNEHIANVRNAMGLPKNTDTVAAHFDGAEYTEDELEEIKKFAEFVKSKRKS